MALWREALLAQKVLCGETKGYHQHPQIERFKVVVEPSETIAGYLQEVFSESLRRSYRFDCSKFLWVKAKAPLVVTDGQLSYEFSHLKAKLARRDRQLYAELQEVKSPEPYPLFKVVPGLVASWEKV